jgi:hypothetical protein
MDINITGQLAVLQMNHQQKFVEKVANKINQLGLTSPAIFLLEAHKPLAFIGSQLLLVAQPTVDIFFPRNSTRNLADVLANPTQVEQLLAMLESKPAPNPSLKDSDNPNREDTRNEKSGDRTLSCPYKNDISEETK